MRWTKKSECLVPARAPHLSVLVASVLAYLVAFIAVTAAAAREPSERPVPQQAERPAMPGMEMPEPLSKLIEEAERDNPQILAARRGWQAASQVPSQVSTLPDPQIMFQQLAVGSPRPFAGYTNSDFAYVGIGFSQDFPYPGKLRLRGEIAARDVAGAEDRVESVRRFVIAQLKAAYFNLAYHLKVLDILGKDGRLLDQIEKIAEARYRVGQGNQQEVLKAQLQKTELLKDIEMHHEEHYRLEAELKQLLNRPPDSADIMTDGLVETPFTSSFDDLRAEVRAQNPEVRGQQEIVNRQGLAVELARKDFYPDFNAQYVWQHTASQFRDYYMLSLGISVPIHWRRKQEPEQAEASAELNRSRRLYEAQVQQTYFDLRDQYLAAETAGRVLKIYREGLIPQATATFDAGLAAYQSGREDFETLLSSFLDVLNLDMEYWRTLAEHETALARIEQVAGNTLP
jgi:outer membrane protein, heavy metal efflux system